MEVLTIKAPGLRQSVSQFLSLLSGAKLVLSERPRLVLSVPTMPTLEHGRGVITATFDGARIEKLGKDLSLKRMEIRETEIRIYTEWVFGIDADILVELT